MSPKTKIRTTVTLEKDVAAAIDRHRRQKDMGLSEAINDLIRVGLIAPKENRPFVQKTYNLGLKMDVSNIGEVLEELEGPWYR